MGTPCRAGVGHNQSFEHHSESTRNQSFTSRRPASRSISYGFDLPTPRATRSNDRSDTSSLDGASCDCVCRRLLDTACGGTCFDRGHRRSFIRSHYHDDGGTLALCRISLGRALQQKLRNWPSDHLHHRDLAEIWPGTLRPAAHRKTQHKTALAFDRTASSWLHSPAHVSLPSPCHRHGPSVFSPTAADRDGHGVPYNGGEFAAATTSPCAGWSNVQSG